MQILKKYYWLLLFIVCIVSRLLTAIYYIEDTDSLRFALAVKEGFDLSKLQPHFPGYPVFIAAVKLLYLLTGSFSTAFALMGGIATFLILFFVVKTIRLFKPDFSVLEWLALLILFFNPLLWLMSNRFMPDLTGLALLAGCFYFFSFDSAQDDTFNSPDKKKRFAGILCMLLAGLLAGTRLSYIPAIALPVGWLLITDKNRFLYLFFLIGGILIWFIPMLMISGWETILESATKQTTGHFSEWGGTIETENSYILRLKKLAEAVWADGMGAYIPGRHWITGVTAVGIIIGAAGSIFFFRAKKNTKTFWLLIISVLIYLLWIYFYQNIIYKPRHILPVLLFAGVVIAVGFNYLIKLSKWNTIFFSVFFAIFAATAIILADQHKKPTAIFQAKEYLRQIESQTIASTGLVNDYLAAQGIDAEFINVEEDFSKADSLIKTGKKVTVVGSFRFSAFPRETEILYHNPFVNKMWPEVKVSQY